MKTKYKITTREKKKYLLPTDRDLEILAKCKLLEKSDLTDNDRVFVKFIKTQLEEDWRTPLLKMLNKLLKKYKVANKR
jgi:hypothetical protein